MKVGDLVYVKTSGEPVSILAVGESIIKVRRAYATRDNGIQHGTDEFYLTELETEQDKFTRELQTRLIEDATYEKLKAATTKPFQIPDMPRAN